MSPTLEHERWSYTNSSLDNPSFVEKQYRRLYLESLHDDARDRDVQVFFGRDNHGEVCHEEVEGVDGRHVVAHQDGSHLAPGRLPFDLRAGNQRAEHARLGPEDSSARTTLSATCIGRAAGRKDVKSQPRNIP